MKILPLTKKTWFVIVAVTVSASAAAIAARLRLPASNLPAISSHSSPTSNSTPLAGIKSPTRLESADSQAKITWSQQQISLTLSPGDNSSQDVTFSSDSNLQNLTVEPVPGIAAFVTVQPNTFSSVPANSPQSIHITFSVSTTVALGTYQGTIHVRTGTQTFPQTMKIVINVWQKFTDTNLGIKLQYPPLTSPTKLRTEELGNGEQLIEFELYDTQRAVYVSAFGIFIQPTPSHLDLPTWFHQNEDPQGLLLAAGTFQQLELANGFQALVLTAPVPADYDREVPANVYAMPTTNDRVFMMQQGNDVGLEAFGYSIEEVQTIFQQILGTIQVTN